MKLLHAIELVGCPHEAWATCESGRFTRMPGLVSARSRVYAAMRCNWRGNPEAEMSLPLVASECGHKCHTTVLYSIRRLCGSADAAACRAWLDAWSMQR